MRVFKITAIALAGVFALLVLCIALVALFFNPNDYKAEIERLVADKTGRQFTLAGDLKLSVFPWLAVELGPATLGNAPGFGEMPMMALEHARLGVRVWPLLHGRFEIGEVRLDAPRLLLMKNAQGVNNWTDLGKGNAAESETQPSSSSTVNASIASLSVRDAIVSYQDRQAGTDTTVRDFSLSTGKLELGRPFDLKSEFKLERGADLNLTAKLSAKITLDVDASHYQLSNPDLSLHLQGPGYPEKGLPLTLHAAAINADLKAQTAQISALSVDASGAKIEAELNATGILDAPKLTGKFNLAPVSVRELAPQFGVKLPVTSDAQALRRLSAEAEVSATANAFELKPLTLRLDDTTLKGSAGIADLAAKALRFDLSVDRINLDRYLPPPVEEAKNPTPADKNVAPTPIPVELLRSLNLRGDLAVTHAIFKGMELSKLRVGINAQGGKLRLNPLQAALYEGQYQGNVALDADDKLPQLSLDEQVSGVNFAPLFKALYKTQRVAGRGNANMKLTARGADTDALKKTLSGTVDFKVSDGAFEGFDLWYEIRRARAVLKQQAIPARTGPERTAFTSLQGSGVMNNGVLSNKDLSAAMQYLKVTGQGEANLISDAVNYRLEAAVLKIPAEDRMAEQTQDLVGLTIPVRITGTLTDPKVRPDVAGFVKEKAQQRIQEEKEKAEQKLKDKLQDKLRGLLGG